MSMTEKLLTVLATARRLRKTAFAERRVSCPHCGRATFWQRLGDVAATDGELIRALREIPICAECGEVMEVSGVEVVIRAVHNQAVVQIVGCSTTRSGDLDSPEDVRVLLQPVTAPVAGEGDFLVHTKYRRGYACPGYGQCMLPDRLLGTSK